jgi:UDP-glucose 4-epimerase
MKPNLLITGASGFIGSHLIEEAMLQEYNIFAAVRKSSKVILPEHSHVTIVQLDYNDSSTLIKQLNSLKQQYGRFDYVIHNAGITRANNVDEFNEVNNLLPQRLANALVAVQNIPEKFLLVSSMAAFGPGDQKSMEPIHARQQMNPISHYGESKKAVSTYFLNQSPLPFIIVYPTAVYGPRDKDFIEFVKLINKGIEPYLGLYRQLLSMVHVRDLSTAIVGLLQKGRVGGQYIISDTKNYDKKELGTIAKDILKKKTFKLFIPVTPVLGIARIVELAYQIFAPKKMPLLTREKIKEISSANWSCDADEVWNVLGKKPQYDLKSGMQHTIDWYKNNGML